MVEISTSILSVEPENSVKTIYDLEVAHTDYYHIDVMDGHFVPNITIGAPVVKSLKNKVKSKLDVHLMIENPDRYICDFIDAGADIITFHIEATSDKTKKCIEMIKQANGLAGIAIKPKTPVSAMEEFISLVDMVLVMTVEPGFSGQKFMPDAAEKIKEVCAIAPNGLIIQVDGGINAETAEICTRYGANCFVAGNFVYKNSDMKSAIESLLCV